MKFGSDGRVLVPLESRRELGVVPGEPFVARVEDGRLVIEHRAAVERLQCRFSVVASRVGLVDELLAHRRSDAARDQHV